MGPLRKAGKRGNPRRQERESSSSPREHPYTTTTSRNPRRAVNWKLRERFVPSHPHPASSDHPAHGSLIAMASTSSSANPAPTSTTRRKAGKKASSPSPPDANTAKTTPAAKGYRHVAAVHREAQPSWLSGDAPETPSFIGFRNLMAISLSALPSSRRPPRRPLLTLPQSPRTSAS
ncbi:hypothetical protein IMZ48_27545 [Candidatus Bathyarchaeota archaeon]|nr:hypothetical protein [Candidatus Bathyarchaeota archaeon]